jgi:hypothetical protein
MNNTQSMSTFLGIAAAAVLAANGHAADINVPGGQPTIQAGINAANPGDVVIVAAGEYFENINFNGKAITVRSTDPNDPVVVMHTIINGGGSGSVVTCNNGEGSNTVLSGFVITGGAAMNGGGGMFNFSSSPTVTDCTFSGNSAGFDGGGMGTAGGSPTVTRTGFCDNTPDQIAGTYTDGGGNCFWDSCVDINGDGSINVLDLIDLLLCFGQPADPGCEAEDVNFDGTVNVLDLIDLLLAFGTTCP